MHKFAAFDAAEREGNWGKGGQDKKALCGDSKKGQSDDIEATKENWAEYKERKRDDAKKGK